MFVPILLLTVALYVYIEFQYFTSPLMSRPQVALLQKFHKLHRAISSFTS